MTRIASWLALSFRLHRWEVLASAAGTFVLAGLMLFLASQLHQLAASELLVPGRMYPTFVQRESAVAGGGGLLLLLVAGAVVGRRRPG